MAAWSARQSSFQYGRCRARRQDGPHCLGTPCGTAQRLNREQSLVDSATGRLPISAVYDVCGWLRKDGLTVDRRSANLRRKMAPRCRPPYEDQNVRISILANGVAERP